MPPPQASRTEPSVLRFAGVDRVTDPTITPYYHLVPKGKVENLAFRRTLLELARRDPTLQDDLWVMCARDPLFWINVFVWTYDPRLDPAPTTVPFITYAVQDEALIEMFRHLGHRDMGFEKSRGQGASWMALVVVGHQWMFKDRQSFLLVSRVESLVDKPGDLDALMPKLDFILEHLPGWMRPLVERTKLHLLNLENGSTIDGASTTGNVGRGGRRRCILLDEFAAFEIDDGYRALAATQATTNCRIFNSTPQGIGNAFYDQIGLEAILRLRLHWSDNPTMNAGLYTARDGKLCILDEGYEFPPDYKFILDGKLRSPWYDNECRRTPILALIAQELDIEYLGSGSQFFDAELLRGLQPFIRSPRWIGELDFDPFSLEAKTFIPSDRGRLRVWCELDGRGFPLTTGDFVIGGDIATGTGASNSCLSAVNLQTGEKVAEFVSSRINPDELAKMALAMAHWLASLDGRPAMLIWEANGPGREFGARILAEGFSNIWYRRNEDSAAARASDIPGFWSTRDTKRVLLSEYARALGNCVMLNRSEDAVRECGEFVFSPDGSIEHVKSRSCLDPSGARENHADRVIADALCAKVLLLQGDKPGGGEEEEEDDEDLSTLAGRRQQRERERKKAGAW
jgi:hypothetical protein